MRTRATRRFQSSHRMSGCATGAKSVWIPASTRRITSAQSTAARSARVRGVCASALAANELASCTNCARVIAWNSHASTGRVKSGPRFAIAIAESSWATAAFDTSA